MNAPATITAPVERTAPGASVNLAEPDSEICRLAEQADAAEAEFRRLDAIQGQMEDDGDMKSAIAYEKEVTDPAWGAWQDLCDEVRDTPVRTPAAILLKLRRMQAEACYDDDHVAPFVIRTVESVIADLERMAPSPQTPPSLCPEARAFLAALSADVDALRAYQGDESPDLEASWGTAETEMYRAKDALCEVEAQTIGDLAVQLQAFIEGEGRSAAYSEDWLKIMCGFMNSANRLAGRPLVESCPGVPLTP